MKKDRKNKGRERPFYYSVDPETVDFFVSLLRLSPRFWEEVLDISCEHAGRRMGLGKLRPDGRIDLEIECKDCDYVERMYVKPEEAALWEIMVAGFRSGQVDSVGWDLPEREDDNLDDEFMNPDPESGNEESGAW